MSESKSSPLILRRKIAFSSSYIYTPDNPIGYGHNFTFEVFLQGFIDERTGLVVNLTDIKPILEQVISLIDHKNLKNDLSEFKDYKVITEADILEFILNKLSTKLNDVKLIGGRLYFLNQVVEKLV